MAPPSFWFGPIGCPGSIQGLEAQFQVPGPLKIWGQKEALEARL